MVTKKDWKEFQDSGLLWFVNTILHMFGWAIVLSIDEDTDEIIDVYPARVKFRGFGESNNTKGYMKVTEYLKNNIEELVKEIPMEKL